MALAANHTKTPPINFTEARRAFVRRRIERAERAHELAQDPAAVRQALRDVDELLLPKERALLEGNEPGLDGDLVGHDVVEELGVLLERRGAHDALLAVDVAARAGESLWGDCEVSLLERAVWDAELAAADAASAAYDGPGGDLGRDLVRKPAARRMRAYLVEKLLPLLEELARPCRCGAPATVEALQAGEWVSCCDSCAEGGSALLAPRIAKDIVEQREDASE